MRQDLLRFAFSAVLLLLPSAATLLADEPPKPACPLVPVPKSYCDHGRTWQPLDLEQTAIVIGPQATEPERYAAGRLQAHIERRFKRRIPILAEAALPEAMRQVFLLGHLSVTFLGTVRLREGDR